MSGDCVGVEIGAGALDGVKKRVPPGGIDGGGSGVGDGTSVRTGSRVYVGGVGEVVIVGVAAVGEDVWIGIIGGLVVSVPLPAFGRVNVPVGAGSGGGVPAFVVGRGASTACIGFGFVLIIGLGESAVATFWISAVRAPVGASTRGGAIAVAGWGVKLIV